MIYQFTTYQFIETYDYMTPAMRWNDIKSNYKFLYNYKN